MKEADQLSANRSARDHQFAAMHNHLAAEQDNLGMARATVEGQAVVFHHVDVAVFG